MIRRGLNLRDIKAGFELRALSLNDMMAVKEARFNLQTAKGE